MYLYSGYNLMAYPAAWHWALPYWFREIMVQAVPLDLYLRAQGAVEVFMALVFLAWFWKPAVVKLVSLLATFEFLVILILAFVPFSESNFLITFRDIGLLGAALALLIMSFSQSVSLAVERNPS